MFIQMRGVGYKGPDGLSFSWERPTGDRRHNAYTCDRDIAPAAASRPLVSLISYRGHPVGSFGSLPDMHKVKNGLCGGVCGHFLGHSTATRV